MVVEQHHGNEEFECFFFMVKKFKHMEVKEHCETHPVGEYFSLANI